MSLLDTHTCYPQVRIDEHHVVEVDFFNADGSSAFRQVEKGENYEDARARAKAIVAENLPNFLRPVE